MIFKRSLRHEPRLHLEPDAGTFSFLADGKRLTLPIASKPAVAFILAQESAGFSAILAAPDVAIAEAALRSLLQALVQHGVITEHPTDGQQ